jgi:mono/diheme cytochrome c family protein
MPRATLIVLIVWLLLALPARADEGQWFREHVAPIFERHCVGCHQGAEPKGGLDLTTQKAALAGGESGAALVAHKPDESPLVELISGDDRTMPKDAPPLSADQIATIRRWIAEGATWPADVTLKEKRAIDQHWWSLEPLGQTAAPASDSSWVRTPVDAFILPALREHGLQPSDAADRRTLIRRLTYDLHGLPPTPEEIEAFAADTSGDAYEKLVDRLLASPRYGERWGRYWLDVVHFGESHGYDKDKPRPNAWPYRDYVIRSLNEDKPYDRFVAEQIAGDVLYPDDPRATVATGMIAAGPWDFVGHVELREGTVDKDIARANDRDDMVASTMSTFLSLTVHCARCHDHKFDPIRQEDYYALQAVFAGVERADRPYDTDPAIARQRAALATAKSVCEDRLASIRDQMAQVTSPEITALDERLATVQRELKELPTKASPTLGYHSQIMSEQSSMKWVQVDLGESQPIEEVVLVPAHVAYGTHPGPGFGFPTRFKVEVADSPDFTESSLVDDQQSSDVPHPGDKPHRVSVHDVRGRYVRITANKLWKRTDDWIFALAELVVMSDSKNVALGKPVTSLDSIEASPSWAMKNLTDGCDSLKYIDGGSEALQRRENLNTLAANLTESRRKLVAAHFDEAELRQFAELEARLKDLERQLAELPQQPMVYAAAGRFSPQGSFAPPKTPRAIHLLARGDVRSPKQLVAPAGVACVQGPPATFELADANNESQRRAALARWLTDPRNGLLRRSIVNRVWQYHFGQGLVDTPNDFGRMGSLPSHPELLEWLAGWFSRQGHSLKGLHRLLVTSAVYRQSSANKPEYAKIDSANRYLWRMNRQRLDAECIRDSVLYVTGKLDLTIGGPSVQQFYFKDDHSPIYDYARFDVDEPRSLRRSVYRFLVRSVPDPFMECLDCADPSIMTPKRNTTLTSIQALALLNNPLLTRQAEHFAARVDSTAGDLIGKIEAAYRLALGRQPTASEAAALTRYANEFGLANACRVIFNSNEFVFID